MGILQIFHTAKVSYIFGEEQDWPNSGSPDNMPRPPVNKLANAEQLISYLVDCGFSLQQAEVSKELFLKKGNIRRWSMVFWKKLSREYPRRYSNKEIEEMQNSIFAVMFRAANKKSSITVEIMEEDI